MTTQLNYDRKMEDRKVKQHLPVHYFPVDDLLAGILQPGGDAVDALQHGG